MGAAIQGVPCSSPGPQPSRVPVSVSVSVSASVPGGRSRQLLQQQPGHGDLKDSAPYARAHYLRG